MLTELLPARCLRVIVAFTVLVALTLVAGPAAHAAAATAAAPPARPARPMTITQALARAASSGKTVPVPGATTATQTLAANPGGTLTLHQSLTPVRTRVHGSWRPLSAALRRLGNGSIATAATASTLRLSAGGSGPLATMSALGKTLSVWLPVPLPAPVLSGSTATYSDVLPGVDIRVTASPQGGFSDVLIVHNAAAAASPQLRRLVLATRETGLKLAAGGAGDVTAADPGGHVVFSAPAPFMWDSAPPRAGTPAVTSPVTGQRLDARSGLPLASTAASPGEGAHTVPVGVAVHSGQIILTPDQKLLAAPSTVFPVYIDPSFTAPSAGSSRNEWTTVNNAFPSQSYWKTTSQLLQVGDNAWNAPYFVARSFVNMPVPSQIYGATILSAQLNMTEEWSPSCSTRAVQAWLTGAISSGTTWNSQPEWSSDQASQTVAHGYDSSCPAAGVGFNIQGAMQSAASDKWPQATFGLRAASESDSYGWKQFADTATMSITYDHPPGTPAGLTTSPVTSCTAATPTVVGDGNVSLYVPVSDPDKGTLGVTIKLWNTATGAAFTGTPTNPQQLYVSSGSTAVFIAHEADLKAAAAGAVTEFSWQAQATDYDETSAWSAVCHFTFDPTRPGSPAVTPPATAAIGQPATFTITPPPSGTVPSTYLYQLNGHAPETVTASAGDASITIVPTRFTNTLTVTSQSAGGNIGEAASAVFNATAAATAADSDLTGDGTADLLTAGSANGLPPGLWLAAGTGTGQVMAAASDLGAEGNGTAGDNAPADFTGAQVISGHFDGAGEQDVLAYYPSGASAGQANILIGSGDGSPIQAQYSGNELTMPAGTLTDFNGDNPVQVANAGNTSGQGYAYPDLIGINGDSLDGYYLEFYPNSDGVGDYPQADPLSTLTPAGGTDWKNWTIATAQLPSGAAMYLWDSSTGALYLWEDLAYSLTAGTLSYTQYAIADGSGSTWNKGATLTLQAAAITGAASPGLWTVGTGGIATAYLATLGSGTATLAAQPAQALLTPSHAWALNDGTSGAAGTAADSAGSLNATGSGNATWNTGDLFSPDVMLDGTNSSLATSGPAVNPAANFSVSFWANIAALNGGVAVSQDMTAASSFRIYPSSTDDTWYLCMATTDTITATSDCVNGGTAKVGAWTQITATYDAVAGAMTLYQDDVKIGTVQHAPLTGSTGHGLQVGDYLYGSAHQHYFDGQVAEVTTYGSALTPAQIAAAQDGAVGPAGPMASGITGKCADDTLSSIANGNKIQLWSCYGDSAQVWTMDSDGTVRAFGTCLTNTGGMSSNGNPIELWTCQAADAAQQWRPGPNDSLVNPATGKCLDDPDSSTTNGTQLDLSTCTATAAQEWRLPYSGLPYAGALTSGIAGKCADDTLSSTANGNKIQVWSCLGDAAQDWVAENDGTMRIFGHCLDNANGAATNGNPIQLWTCLPGDASQQWEPGPDGYLVNPATHMCLDDPHSSTTNGTQLDLYTCNGSSAQVWTLPATTVPGTVTSVTATAGTGRATLSWTAPTATGGTPITGYTVTAQPGGAAVTVTGTTATVAGLASGTAYAFTVTAANAVGSGTASAPTSPVTAG